MIGRLDASLPPPIIRSIMANNSMSKKTSKVLFQKHILYFLCHVMSLTNMFFSKKNRHIEGSSTKKHPELSRSQNSFQPNPHTYSSSRSSVGPALASHRPPNPSPSGSARPLREGLQGPPEKVFGVLGGELVGLLEKKLERQRSKEVK